MFRCLFCVHASLPNMVYFIVINCIIHILRVRVISVFGLLLSVFTLSK